MTNRIELAISERRSFAGGHGFDDAGPYERIRGRALFTIDPDAEAQEAVVDIGKAPRDR